MFLQFHALVPYPPANPNRDENGRPKTAHFGGEDRLRISSQCLKRAWRESEVFQAALGDRGGIRTRSLGPVIKESLETGRSLRSVLDGTEEEPVRDPLDSGTGEWAEEILKEFGPVQAADDDDEYELQWSQLIFVSPNELDAIEDLLNRIAESGAEPDDEEIDVSVIRDKTEAIDVSMFGRMISDKPNFSIEGAVQTSHAITVHPARIESDFFTAVDDLNERSDDEGSAHMNFREFSAGLFYQYACVDTALLEDNLVKFDQNGSVVENSLQAFLEAMCTVTPDGFKNSFAHQSRAVYALVEATDGQPRSLASLAFREPVPESADDQEAIEQLQDSIDQVESAYPQQSKNVKRRSMSVPDGEGSLEELKSFVSEVL